MTPPAKKHRMKLSVFVLTACSLLSVGPASVAGSEAVKNEGKHPSLRREQQPAGHAALSSFEQELQEQMESLIRRLDEKDAHEQALMRRLEEQDAELQELRRHVASGSFSGGRSLAGSLLLTQGMMDDLAALLAALTAFDGNDAGEQFINAIASPIELSRIREVLRYLVPNGDLNKLQKLAALDTDALTLLDADQLEKLALSLDRVDPDGLNAITMPDVVEKLQGLTGCMRPFADTEEVIVQGCDFIVRGNGGETYALVDPDNGTGKGNLIVGWNEGDPSTKGGLNNLIVGPWHSYYGTGGVVFGNVNTIYRGAVVSGGTLNTAWPHASVTGGRENHALGAYASVSGGFRNTAGGYWPESYASVSGGFRNTASGTYASVSGGQDNTASGIHGSVSGGRNNTASEESASVSGGLSNTASGEVSSVSGGELNTASFQSASISGGLSNTADGSRASVSGGFRNTASGNSASVSGGQDNTADGQATSVSGGQDNDAGGQATSVSGGRNNGAGGLATSVIGGLGGFAGGEYSYGP